MNIERGCFYLADLNPQRGTEAGKTRPVLVLQTDLLNVAKHPSTIVIPVTSNIEENAEPLRVRIPKGSKGFQVDSDLMIDQVRAIDNRRLYKYKNDHLIKKIARADWRLMQKIEKCIKMVCDLN